MVAGRPGAGLPQVPAGESGTNVGRESAGSPRAPAAAAAAARAITVRSVFPPLSPRLRRLLVLAHGGAPAAGSRVATVRGGGVCVPPSAAAAAPSTEPSERLKMASLTRRFL